MASSADNRYSEVHTDEHIAHTDEHHKHKLPIGTVIGIIIACIIIFIGIVCLIIWLCGGFKKNNSGGTDSSDGGSGSGGDSGSGSSSRFGKLLKGAQLGFGAYNLYGLMSGGGSGIFTLIEDGMKALLKMFMFI
jgi:hypothetical protein